MPVYKLLEEMPYEELLGWFSYFEKRPFGWQADDRAAKLLQVQGVKSKPQELFSSLSAIYNPKKDEDGFDVNSFKRSAFFQKIAMAQGGEQIL